MMSRLTLALCVCVAGTIGARLDKMAGTRMARQEKLTMWTGKTSGSTQDLWCYEGSGGGGDAVHAIDYIPDLANYNMDNRISYCCVTGIWLLYAENDYNGYSTGSSNWWAYGDNYCLDLPQPFIQVASSLRFTGAPDDWKYDTLNFYFNNFFIGDEEFTYTDMPQLNYNNRAQSLIVTGCSPWTLYTDTYYRGQAMCVFPSDSSQCLPGLYDSQHLSLAGQISSAKRGGCFSEKRLYPANYDMMVTGNGTSGFFSGH